MDNTPYVVFQECVLKLLALLRKKCDQKLHGTLPKAFWTFSLCVYRRKWSMIIPYRRKYFNVSVKENNETIRIIAGNRNIREKRKT